MPSLRARFYLSLLKHRHWLRLQWRRPRVDMATSIPALRARADRSAQRFGALPDDVVVEQVAIGELAAEWIRPPGAPGACAILYFHGGGYVMGSRASHRGVVSKFAAGSGLPALLFDYRLAPEHRFPAALDDAVSAYRWLLSQGIAPARIAFVGDSAGGGLCLATLLALRERGIALPAAAVALSPWTDLQCVGASYRRRDPVAPDGSWEVFAAHYGGTHDRTDPLMSPLHGSLAGLPPVLILVGDDEAMLDDSTRFAAKARAAGVDVRLQVGRGMVHCYPVMAPLFPEATAAMEAICGFLRTRIQLER